MKPYELKLIRSFNKIKKDVEDTIMTTINEKISKETDKEAFKQFNNIVQKNNEFLSLLDKFKELEDFHIYKKEYFDNLDEYEALIVKFSEYFREGSNFSNGILKIVAEEVREQVEELQILIGMTYSLNCQKTANNLRLQLKKLMDVIVYFLNRAANDVISPYKQTLNQYLYDTNEKITQKASLLEYLTIEKSKNEDNCMELKKIMDCRKMNKWMKQLGYEGVRQNGSHKIYSKGNKSIPVPQHSRLHKGLGYTIQKQAIEV